MAARRSTVSMKDVAALAAAAAGRHQHDHRHGGDGHRQPVLVGNSAQRADREATQLAMFERQRVRGLLLAPIGGVGDRLAGRHRRGIPVVIVDRAGDDLDCCSVAVDDVGGGRLAVEHLIGRGHTRIAFVGGPSDVQQVRDRRLGAELAAGSGARCELLAVSTAGLDAAAGVAAAEQLAVRPDDTRPTAAFAANDLVAIGLLQGFTTQGLRVRQDIAVIGYDDIGFAATAAVSLSSIRQPRRDLGRRAAELMFEEIAAADGWGSHVHHRVRFVPELVARRSTAAASRTGRAAGR